MLSAQSGAVHRQKAFFFLQLFFERFVFHIQTKMFGTEACQTFRCCPDFRRRQCQNCHFLTDTEIGRCERIAVFANHADQIRCNHIHFTIAVRNDIFILQPDFVLFTCIFPFACQMDFTKVETISCFPREICDCAFEQDFAVFCVSNGFCHVCTFSFASLRI